MQPLHDIPARWSLPRPLPLARALAAASLLTLALPPADVRAEAPAAGLPVGPSVASGQAQISVSASGSTMTIVNTPQTILNWNSFSIGAGKSVVFQQANANSAVLNRVTGQEASSIFGSLSSNGRVWLLNPNGVLFGPGARVDVGGLVASTLRLSDSDWLAGRYSFESGAAGASIVNQGSLRSSFGGRIALLSSNVANEGVIDASGGQIVLAAGSTVELVDTGAPYVGVRVSAPSGEARNLGSIQAAGGRIDIHAAAVNSSGIISADGFVSGPGGEVWIKAVGPIGLAAGSRTTANAGALGGNGGMVHIASSSGRSSLQGEVSAQSPQGLGGAVAVLGREVGLLDQATIDVSGALGGGKVVAGGGLQGRDPTYANAQALFFGPQARISADATQQGAGGQIVMWSDQATRAYGSLSVRGGPLGGDGGFIETSGGWLDARPASLDTAAPRGRSGSWLLDPYDITISDAVTPNNVSPDFTATGDDAFISTTQLAAALNAGTHVTVSTGGAATGSQSGHINVTAANLQVTAASPGKLTLLADDRITLTNSTLASSAGPMDVQLLAGGSGSGSITMVSSSITTPGNITLDGVPPVGGAANPEFVSGTGSISLDRSSLNGQTVTLSASSNGIWLANSFLSAADLLVQGSAGEGTGVSVTGASVLSAINNLTVIGDASFGTGIQITDGASITLDPAGSAGSHLLRLDGFSANSGADIEVSPDAPDGAVITTRGGASLSIEGTNRIAIAGQAIDAAGGGPVRISADRLDITGEISGSQLNFSGDQVRFGIGANVSATGSIQVAATELTIEAGAALRAESPGGSILLAGPNDTPLSSLVNDAGAGGLLVSGSARYIVYADSPSALGSVDAGLTPNFKRVGAAFGAWSADAGNGLVFREARNAEAVLSIASRSYDGTRNAPIDGAVVTASDFGTLRADARASYANANAGVDKPATLDSPNAFTFTDANDIPIFGYTVTTVGSGTVVPASLSGNASVLSRVYDAGTSARISVANLTGLAPGEQIEVSGSGQFNDKNVGNNKPVGSVSYTLRDGPLGLASNYRFVPETRALTGSITPLAVSLAGLTATNKVYDGRSTATLTGTPSAATLAGDSVSLAGTATASFADKNVGTAKAVTVNGYTLTGTDAGNYRLSQPQGLSANITPLTVNVAGVTADNKVYDGNSTASLAGTATAATLAGDSVSLAGTATASFADKNVGTAKAVTVNGYTLSGTDAGNYRLSQPQGLSANITPLAVNVAGLTAVSKVYDSSTTARVAGTARAATLAGDSVSLQGQATASFADKNVGTAKAVTVTGYTLTGADAGNYRLTQPQGLTANITPLAVSVAGVTATSKVYDGGTTATLAGTANAATLSGDNVSLSGQAVASFADKNVGTAKAVTVSGYTLTGADAGNYELTQPQGLSADITPFNLSVNVSGVSAASKVYDGTNTATLVGTASAATLAGDNVSLQGQATATFADKNVGTAKAVTVNGYTLSGADAGNYQLAQPQGLTADITPLSVTVAGLTATNKVYDGSSTARLTGTASAATLVGDNVSLAGTATASFADKNVGTAKAVTVNGYTLTGADAGNYQLAQPQRLSANITPLTVNVAGVTADNKVYDGNTTARLGGTASAATLAGDNVSLAGTATASFADKNVGTAKAVTVNGYTLTGADAGNYQLAQPQGLSANITPLAASVAGVTANNKVYDGNTTARLAGTASAATLAGDSVSLAGTATASFADKNVGTAKAVTVNGYTLTGADAGNYQLAQPQGLSASITPLTVNVAGVIADNKVYDGNTTARLAGTATAATLAGDNVSLAGTATASFADKNVGTAKAVTVNGYTLTGADAGNYQLAQPQGLSANITPLAVSVAGVTATNKVYDGNTTARLAGTASAATLAGDSVSLAGTATASFADKNVGTAKAVTVNGYTLTGADAGNYQLAQPQGLSASITPATLQYVATAAVRGVGSTAQPLEGTVVGFVGTDTQANSSEGTLAFNALATPRSPPGRYGVVGSGLSAVNYVFEQAPGNAQALTLIDLGQQAQTSVANASSPTAANTGQTALPSAGAASPVPRIAGLSDQTSPLPPSNAAPVSDFRAVRLSSMSTSELADLLAGRRSYMSNLLSEAVQILTRDPDAAALRECSTLDEARLGRCIVTEQLKASLASAALSAPQTASGTATDAPATAGAAAQPGSGSANVQPPPAPPTASGSNIVAGTEAAATPAPPAPPQASTPPPPPIALASADPIPRFDATKRAVRNAALPEIERKIALLIGVDKYQDPGIPTLSNAVNDARAVADILTKRLGYEVALLENPGRQSLVAALNQLALTLRPRDSVVIYYAGHGELVAATNLGYWLLSDSVANQPETWLANTDINKLVAQMGASQVALVSDSCYSGSLTSEERIRAPSTPPDPKAMLQRRSVVVMSSGGNEPVADEGRDGHSPFAWNLMRQLEQLNSWQLGGSVFERVRFAVARVLPQRPQYTASRIAGHQPGGDYLFEQRALVSDR